MSNLRTLTKSARWETTHHGIIVPFSFLFSFICFRVLFYFIVLNLEFCITFILALHSAYCIIKKIRMRRERVADASASHVH